MSLKSRAAALTAVHARRSFLVSSPVTGRNSNMRTSNVWKLIAIASTLGMMLSLACHASVAVNSASAEQPHMQSARDHLQAAKAELQAADPNKGGHRENAMG